MVKATFQRYYLICIVLEYIKSPNKQLLMLIVNTDLYNYSGRKLFENVNKIHAK